VAESLHSSAVNSGAVPDTGVAVFAYNRPKQLAGLFESILAAELSNTYPYYVFADGPKSGVSGEAEKIEEVREVCRRYSSFLDMTIQCSATNQGLAQSVVRGVGSVLGNHERIIVLEDDLNINRHFFRFMSIMLDRYSNANEILQISAWMVPARGRLPPVGFYRVPGSWGWATWRRAWKLYDHDLPKLISGVSKKGIRQFNADGVFDHFNTLLENERGQKDTWAIRWYASMYINGGFALYPSSTLVSNLGFDGSGTNCGVGTLPYSKPSSVDFGSWQSECIAFQGESLAYAQAFERFYGELISHWTRISMWKRVINRLRRSVLPKITE